MKKHVCGGRTHVIYSELQAELMKRGVCNITGAGSNCSALPMAAR
jgi:hypothetical protein